MAPFFVCSVVIQPCVKRRWVCTGNPWRLGPSWMLQAEHRQGCPAVYVKAKGTAAPWLILLGELLEASISWLLLCIPIHLLSQWLFQWQAIQAQKWKCCLLISSFLDYRSPTFQSFGDTDLHVLLLRIGSGLSVAPSACQALEQGRRRPKSALFNLSLKVFCSEHGSAG